MLKDIVRDLSNLVSIPSVTDRSNSRIAKEAGRILKREGFRVTFQTKKLKGQIFKNVIGIKGPLPANHPRGGRHPWGGSHAAPLLLCAHLDTVPAGSRALWTKTRKDPWRPTQIGQKLFGLGSADDKGSFAAMAYAGGRFETNRLKHPLVVLGSFGEESGMEGAKLFTESWKGTKPRAAIVGEPTGLTITYRHKGMGVLEVRLKRVIPAFPPEADPPPAGAGMTSITKTFYGKQAHSSRPWLGDNALLKAMAFIEGLPHDAWVKELEGGYAANLIPDRANTVITRTPGGFPAKLIAACHSAVQKTVREKNNQDKSFVPPVLTSNLGIARTEKNELLLVYDFRLLPGQNLKTIARTIQRRFPSARLRMERDNPPLPGKKEEPLVRQACELLKKNGLKPKLVTKPSCTEAGVYRAWGVPAIVFGPGEATGNIHAPNESLDLIELQKAAWIYENFIEKFCT